MTPSMSWSLTRSAGSQPPGRASVFFMRSLYSSGLRPAMAASPWMGERLPSKTM